MTSGILLFSDLGKNLMNLGYEGSTSIFLRRYKSHFGVSPYICDIIWNKIKTTLPSNFSQIHLLWTLYFLKCYNTEHINASFAQCDEKTFRQKCWKIIKELSSLTNVVWDERKRHAVEGQKCFISLDGVDFRIQEPGGFDTNYYSHKFRAAGLRYEVGLCIRSGEIVWSHGGYPCGLYPDLVVARELLVHILERNEKVMADKGYNDRNIFILPTEQNGQQHKLIMSRHETVNKRLRHFKILYDTFRHDKTLHPQCFKAVLNITQFVIKFEEPLFSVN